MGLWFEFVTETVNNTMMHIDNTMILVVAEWCLYRVKVFSVSHAALPVRRLEMYRKLGDDTTRTATQTNQRGIPYHIISCSAISTWGEVCLGCCCLGLAGHKLAGDK